MLLLTCFPSPREKPFRGARHAIIHCRRLSKVPSPNSSHSLSRSKLVCLHSRFKTYTKPASLTVPDFVDHIQESEDVSPPYLRKDPAWMTPELASINTRRPVNPNTTQSRKHKHKSSLEELIERNWIEFLNEPGIRSTLSYAACGLVDDIMYVIYYLSVDDWRLPGATAGFSSMDLDHHGASCLSHTARNDIRLSTTLRPRLVSCLLCCNGDTYSLVW